MLRYVDAFPAWHHAHVASHPCLGSSICFLRSCHVLQPGHSRAHPAGVRLGRRAGRGMSRVLSCPWAPWVASPGPEMSPVTVREPRAAWSPPCWSLPFRWAPAGVVPGLSRTWWGVLCGHLLEERRACPWSRRASGARLRSGQVMCLRPRSRGGQGSFRPSPTFSGPVLRTSPVSETVCHASAS